MPIDKDALDRHIQDPVGWPNNPQRVKDKLTCKRCGTILKSKISEKSVKTAEALRDMGIRASGKIYWCPKCYPKE